MKNCFVLVISLLLTSIQLLNAADESAAFADFQRLATQSEVKSAMEKFFKRDHPGPISKVEMDKFERTLIESAMTLFGRTKEF